MYEPGTHYAPAPKVRRTPRNTGYGGIASGIGRSIARRSASNAARYRGGGGGGGGYYGGGGGGSGGGGGGGGGGGLKTAPAPKPKPPPSLDNWLKTDADYQDQLRAFERAMKDFGADVTRRTGKVNADYESGVKNMGEQRVKDLQDIMNDFASRGLLKSGLFGQRQADYEKQYQSNLGELGRNRKGLLGDITQEQAQFKRQQELQKESARKEAARRRAEKYGI